MNEKDLFAAIGGAEEQDLERSRRTPPRHWQKWAVAACLCLAVGAGAALVLPQVGGAGTASNANHADGESDGTSTAAASENNNIGIVESPETEAQSEGVTIPAITLPEAREESDAMSDMVGTLVYQGGIYTEARTYYDSVPEELLSLLGEKLGTASGTLDEWSAQDDYATEFASTYTGEVYTVTGYDASFRLAVVEGTGSEMILAFLERLNGITLTVGSDLFEDRLHLSENLASITCQTYDDWNHGIDNETPFTGCTDEEWAAFLAALDEASFVYAYEENPDIYASEGQAFLNCTLSDGTTVQLRLIEGGYVGYGPMSWYFVKLPEAVFAPVYQAVSGSSGDYNG